MKIMILGGDGFCGWPTALHLSRRGHEITIVDNFSRRKIDDELGTCSLTPIAPLSERLDVWKRIANRDIAQIHIDLATEYHRFLHLLQKNQPDTIIHFAEQRAAPYSMKNSHTKRYTVDNNVSATHNVLAAIVESNQNIHLIHLGTMGVYGYGTAGIKIPEGYLDINIPQKNKENIEAQILYPTNPGSIYHMTKSLDQILFAFYAKNDHVRITDLHQGIIWGTNTQETLLDEKLINRFDYDGEYGTVLNRFLVQAAIGHPLTVHGTGGQTRAFIHIQDMVRCLELALLNPPRPGDHVKILNQMTETHRLRDLAHLIAKISGADIDFLPNPRQESSENNLLVANETFLNLGLEPTKLSDGLLREVEETARRYAHRVDTSKIAATSLWNRRVSRQSD